MHVHHQECCTVHTAMVYVTQVTVTACEQDQDVQSSSCSQAVSKPVWHIPLLCVQWKTADDEQRNCPKHVEFYSKNKFEKLVHLVGFIIRIYHDARSPERQKPPHSVGDVFSMWWGARNLLWSDGDTFNYDCIIVSSPWRWSDYWPKHFGEHIWTKNAL